MSINNFILIVIGGSMGALLRYVFVSTFNAEFAYGTLISNGLGSFLAGVFAISIIQSGLSDEYKLLLLVGFCGSLTTLSAISLDSVGLYMNAEYMLASISLIANIVVSLMCVVMGMLLTKIIISSFF